jgi:deoxyribodipyrimidine photo-lyase
MTDRPLILWFRRDLRLADQPMLAAAAALGRPVVPVFILDPETEALGAAAKWRLGLAVEAFATALAGLGVRLTCGAVRRWRCCAGWSRRRGRAGSGGRGCMIRQAVARDTGVKAALKAEGLRGAEFRGASSARALGGGDRAGRVLPGVHALLEGDAGMPVPAPEPAPKRLRGVERWPQATGWRTGGWARR